VRRFLSWRWWLRWRDREFRIIRIPGELDGRSTEVFYIETRFGWFRWHRTSWTRPGGVKRGHFRSDGYSTYAAADVARLELRTYYGSCDELAVDGPTPPKPPAPPKPPPKDPPDLRVHITEARTKALEAGVVQVLEDAMRASDNLNRFAWEDDQIWAPSNRSKVASILAHASASLEALLVSVRDIETELAMRRQIPSPMNTVIAGAKKRPPKPPQPVESFRTQALRTSAESWMDEGVTTAPPYTPLAELRDAGRRKGAILDLEADSDESPTK
jgi:hypothetical protein